MAASEAPRKRTTRRTAPRPSDDAAAATSSAVRQAAEVLEEQLSTGLAGARRLSAGFARDHRVDRAAFDEVLERLRSSAHELIDVVAAQAPDLGTQEVQGLAARFAADAHSMFDVMIDLATTAPDLANRLAGAAEREGVPRPTAKRPATRRPAS